MKVYKEKTLMLIPKIWYFTTRILEKNLDVNPLTYEILSEREFLRKSVDFNCNVNP